MNIRFKELLKSSRNSLLAPIYVFRFLYLIGIKFSPAEIRDLFRWSKSNWRMPAPQSVKQDVLVRYSLGKTWIETGTYLGKTTKFLARNFGEVFSFEPADKYFTYSQIKLSKFRNVTLINSSSEDGLSCLISVLLKQKIDSVNFWFDGHFSARDTFQGDFDTPIKKELEQVSRLLNSGVEVVVFIDDVRCFVSNDPQYESYPSISELTYWAESNQLKWCIEHDIFIARSFF